TRPTRCCDHSRTRSRSATSTRPTCTFRPCVRKARWKRASQPPDRRRRPFRRVAAHRDASSSVLRRDVLAATIAPVTGRPASLFVVTVHGAGRAVGPVAAGPTPTDRRRVHPRRISAMPATLAPRRRRVRWWHVAAALGVLAGVLAAIAFLPGEEPAQRKR